MKVQNWSVRPCKKSDLDRFRLWLNGLGEGGAKHLSEALQNNQSLLKLSFSSNNIGDGGAKLFSQALQTNQTLHTLYPQYNEIGDIGTKYLSETLIKNQTLKALYLPGNKIGDGIQISHWISTKESYDNKS